MPTDPQPAQSGASADQQPSGIDLIAAERKRQVEVEKWTAEHDDGHKNGELSMAAAAYESVEQGNVLRILESPSVAGWPWDIRWFKPFSAAVREFPHVDRLRCLIKAGALYQADMERLLRSNIANRHILADRCLNSIKRVATKIDQLQRNETPTAASEPQQPTPQPAYDPPPPDMSLEEQVRHARGFAAGICRNDHHVSRLLEQMARSIEHLAAAAVSAPTAAPQPDKTPGQTFVPQWAMDEAYRLITEHTWGWEESASDDLTADQEQHWHDLAHELAEICERREAAAQAVTEQLRERLAEAERELAKWKEHLIAANDDIERLRKQRTAAQHHIADWKHASGCQTPNDLVAALTAERAAREQAERELAAAEKSQRFTHQWYAERWERLRDLFRGQEIEQAACAIMANGTADPCEPPAYAQLLNTERHRREAAESKLTALQQRAEAAEAERGELLKQLSRIAEITGKPGCRTIIGGPITLTDQTNYVVESVQTLSRAYGDSQERLEAVTPDGLERFAASQEHHEEHHRREAELEQSVAQLRAVLEQLLPIVEAYRKIYMTTLALNHTRREKSECARGSEEYERWAGNEAAMEADEEELIKVILDDKAAITAARAVLAGQQQEQSDGK